MGSAILIEKLNENDVPEHQCAPLPRTFTEEGDPEYKQYRVFVVKRR